MSFPVALTAFFGFLGVSLIILICVALVARKYLRGDFTKIPNEDHDIDQPLLEAGEEINSQEENDDDDDVITSKSVPLTPLSERKAAIIAKYKRPENTENITKQSSSTPENSKTTTLLETSKKFYMYNDQHALEKIRNDHGEEFASQAVMCLQLQYLETTRCIVGNIRTVKYLNFESPQVPRDIQFHLKLLPGAKFRMKTPWRPVSTKQLTSTFTIGPVPTAKMLKCRLYIRLYGRMSSKVYSGSHCYGETSIDLKDLIGKEKGINIEKAILPKGKDIEGGDSKDKDEEHLFTTDSEADT